MIFSKKSPQPETGPTTPPPSPHNQPFKFVPDGVTEDIQNVRKNTLTSHIPVTELPSSFLPYPENCKIYYSTYSYYEIRLINESDLRVADQYIIMLDGIHTTFDKNSITFQDFLYISLLRKLSCMEADRYTVPYTCPKCKNRVDHQFMLNEISFNTLELEELPVVLEGLHEKELQFRPFTVGNYIDLNQKDIFFIKRNSDYLLDKRGNKIVDFCAVLASQCTSLPFKEAYNLIKNSSNINAYGAFKEIDAMFNHGLLPLTFQCQAMVENGSKKSMCNHEINLSLLGGERLIVPFQDQEVSTEIRIRYGTKKDGGSV